MTFKEKIILGYRCSEALLCNRRKPFIISWAITERCSLECKYCIFSRKPLKELNTSEILGIIDKLYRSGTRIIRFTGGEPLLRDDIATIINHSRELNIFTTISTNGILLAYRLDSIQGLDGITISLDGPEDTHDYLRGNGSHAKAIEALRLVRDKNIAVQILTVLNSKNLNKLEYLLDIAKQFNARVYFQPMVMSNMPNREQLLLSPDIKQYKETMLDLIKLKKVNRHIGNSTLGLKHLYHWPEQRQINCVAGKIIFRLNSQGDIYPCSRYASEFEKSNTLGNAVDDGITCFSFPACKDCWSCSQVELNLMFAPSMDAIINMVLWH